ncbi:MAG: aldehyde dehydrogenase [Isosphaera sp.]|nr:aldehyde dehydrogenase [Isosphaera sp.]
MPDPSPVKGRLAVAGEWSAPRADFESRNPADLAEVVGAFPAARPAEVAAAVDAARAAFPAWRRTSRILRAECFDRLAQLVKRDTDDLADLMARECGKNVTECRAEVVEGLHMIQYVFGSGRHGVYGEVVASEIAEKDAFVRRKPWGVVAVITPWNFPFAVPLWMLGPSLLEGNTCVFKPSEDTPAVGQRLAELFAEAGFPAGTVNLLHGAAEVGEGLVRNPGVNVVCFTGSSEVGRRIQEISAAMPDRTVAAEMGGKNAVIVCDDARFDLAVTAGILSAFKTTGQRCVSASRILVHESLIDRYAKAFVDATKRLRFGDPLDPRNFAGPLIHTEAVEKVLRYNALARKEGAKVLLDAGEFRPEPDRNGCFLSPFVYRADWRPGIRSLREEVFGPHVALIPFRDDADAARIANDTDYGLSMAVITESYRRMRFYRDECDYGMGYVNLPCIGAEVHLPFGGVKRSGNGHPSAAALAAAVTHPTAWTVNHGTEIKMAQGLAADIAEDADVPAITGPEHRNGPAATPTGLPEAAEAPRASASAEEKPFQTPELWALVTTARVLPTDLVRQVADFAEFVGTRHGKPPAARPPAKLVAPPPPVDDDEVDLGSVPMAEEVVDLSGVYYGTGSMSSIGLI